MLRELWGETVYDLHPNAEGGIDTGMGCDDEIGWVDDLLMGEEAWWDLEPFLADMMGSSSITVLQHAE